MKVKFLVVRLSGNMERKISDHLGFMSVLITNGIARKIIRSYILAFKN